MSGHSGGSWKVAYADFVTAMMAFFLVMWIGAQDTKVRQSVANYFVDPSGVSKKPVHTGAVLNSMTYGALPKESSVAMGKGRQSLDSPGEPSPATKSMNDWIHADGERLKYWRSQAQRCREAAAANPARDPNETIQEAASKELARQLQGEIYEGGVTKVSGIYQDLLIGALNDVNWYQIAEDMLTLS